MFVFLAVTAQYVNTRIRRVKSAERYQCWRDEDCSHVSDSEEARNSSFAL
jgi:hypothetical protein